MSYVGETFGYHELNMNRENYNNKCVGASLYNH